MKKILCVFAVLVLFVLSSVLGIAEELTQAGDTDSHGVYAKYYYSSDPYVHSAILEDGKYTITAEGGFTVTVLPDAPETDRRLVLKVIPAEEESYDWFKSCTGKIGDDIIPLDIFYVDDNGNRTELTDSVKVEVSLPDNYGTPAVCKLSTEGNATKLKSSFSNNKVTFNTDDNNYYVIASNTSDSPQTGDCNIKLWIMLSVLSLTIFLLVFAVRRGKAARKTL